MDVEMGVDMNTDMNVGMDVDMDVSVDVAIHVVAFFGLLTICSRCFCCLSKPKNDMVSSTRQMSSASSPITSIALMAVGQHAAITEVCMCSV